MNKLEMLKIMVGNSEDDSVLEVYLQLAGDAIIKRAYPFDNTVTEVSPKYDMIQVNIAAYLINKRGAEGQLTHSENGISRSYDSSNIPETMLCDVVPFTGGIR